MCSLTPDQYDELIITPLRQSCRCSSPAFQKLISFNFEDYGISPTALWDSELIIQEIIRKKYLPINEPLHQHGETSQQYHCPECQRTCTEFYSEYSINMYRSYVLFQEDLRASSTHYLLGLRGFSVKDYESIHDFHQTVDIPLYLNNLSLT